MLRRTVILIAIAASVVFAAPKIKAKPVPSPTVESVKAMSAVNLLSEITDNEELMLDNAKHSVPDTLDVLLRIHRKRAELLTYKVASLESPLDPNDPEKGSGLREMQKPYKEKLDRVIRAISDMEGVQDSLKKK
jgi:hypothetical protein